MARYRFRPGLIPTMVVALLLPLFLGLGVWQLHRGAEKRELMERFAEQGRDPPVSLDDRSRSLEGLRYRPVTVKGSYLEARQLLLDNQVFRGVVGYHVLTPLVLEGGKMAILVNRGWVPLGRDRKELPEVGVAGGPTVVTGRLNHMPRPAWKLGPPLPPGDDWPKVVQYVESGGPLEASLGYPVMDRLVLLDPDQPDGFTREWQAVPFGPDRHLGYAFQWFSLAVALVVLYGWLNLRRVPARRQDREENGRDG
jgi:surfeit locus 1 family protein